MAERARKVKLLTSTLRSLCSLHLVKQEEILHTLSPTVQLYSIRMLYVCLPLCVSVSVCACALVLPCGAGNSAPADAPIGPYLQETSSGLRPSHDRI